MTTYEKISILVFLLAIVTVYLLEAAVLANLITKKISPQKVKTRLLEKLAPFTHTLALLGICCFLYGYFIEPYWLEVKHISVQTEKLKQTSFRVVQLSDMHCNNKPLNEQKVVEITNSLKPDIIVFTGDSLNTPEGLDRFRQTLAQLQAKIAKYAVYGNVDIKYLTNLNLRQLRKW